MSVRRGVVTGALLLVGGTVFAAGDKLPDEDFLEYLGSWEETDEDWLMLEKEAQKEERKRDGSDTSDDESAEAKDED